MEKVKDLDNVDVDTPAVFTTVAGWINHGFKNNITSTALCFGKESLSYDSLYKLSNKIANYLNSQGVNKGDRVGICFERSIEMIACIIGILKSGAAYVPLDPNYPVDRLKIMREDADISLLIAHKKYSDRFESDADSVVLWEEINKKINKHSALAPSLDIDGEDVAYVIFTSGSTGRPKGIELPHRALANLIEWQLERDYFKNGARVLQYSSISFDVSFQEIATTLASGGTLFLITDEERRDPRMLLKFINHFKIERLFIPFVALRSLIEVAITTEILPVSLKEVITAGEQLRVDSGMREFFSKLEGSILENQYGPSETHVISAYLLEEDPSKWSDLPPIGKSIKNNSIYILDENMQPVEEGTTGELYLAGRNLAHGYIGGNGLTKKSFIRNPLDIPNRSILYKTGDLGLYNRDGVIEFLGRADHQIKIRGYRIEPGEINNVGAKYPGVAQCFTHAVYHQDGNARLITYYVTKKGNVVNRAGFKTHLEEILPEYMVPTFIMELDDIPYTPSGKVDLKSLPKPDIKNFDSNQNKEITYKTKTESQLAKIWGDLLGFDKIPRTSNFFDLGGDSLKAVTLFMQIEKLFGTALPLSILTQAPNIKGLAKIIDGKNEDLELSRFRSLQLIQRGSSDKTPLFLVHGGAGNVLMFKDLAKGLPEDQPVYAFQWSGWDGNKGEDDILEMAKAYKKELREAKPSGPYRLGGHCIGGIIAIEIAELLKQEGTEVLDPILVSDAPNLHSKYYHPSEPESYAKDNAKFEKLVNKLDINIPKSTKNKEMNDEVKKRDAKSLKKPRKRFPLLAKILPFYSFFGKKFTKLKYNYSWLNIWFKVKCSISIPVGDRRFYSSKTQRNAIKKHKKTVFSGDILYFKSEVLHGRKIGLKGWWDDIFFGFEELCSGQFDGHVIGGKHNDTYQYDITHEIINKKMFSNPSGLG